MAHHPLPKPVKVVDVRARVTPGVKKLLVAWAKESKVPISDAAGYLIAKSLGASEDHRFDGQ